MHKMTRAIMLSLIFSLVNDFQVMMEYKTLKNMLELDCYYLMGMFVSDYIMQQGGVAKASTFEIFLLNSLNSVTKNHFVTIAFPLLLQQSDLMNEIGTLFHTEMKSTEIDDRLMDLFERYCSNARQGVAAPGTPELDRFYY